MIARKSRILRSPTFIARFCGGAAEIVATTAENRAILGALTTELMAFGTPVVPFESIRFGWSTYLGRANMSKAIERSMLVFQGKPVVERLEMDFAIEREKKKILFSRDLQTGYFLDTPASLQLSAPHRKSLQRFDIAEPKSQELPSSCCLGRLKSKIQIERFAPLFKSPLESQRQAPVQQVGAMSFSEMVHTVSHR